MVSDRKPINYMISVFFKFSVTLFIIFEIYIFLTLIKISKFIVFRYSIQKRRKSQRNIIDRNTYL